MRKSHDLALPPFGFCSSRAAPRCPSGQSGAAWQRREMAGAGGMWHVPPPPRRPPGVSQARLRQGMERRCLGCSVWREMRRDEPRARPPGGVTIRGRSLTALSPGSQPGAADVFQLNRCGHALRPAEKDREAAPGARQAASRPPCIPPPQEASGRPLSQREGRNRAPGRGRRVGEEPVAISHPCSGPSTGKGPGLRRSGRVCVRACVHRRVCASS